jgi:TonB-dependent receptor
MIPFKPTPVCVACALLGALVAPAGAQTAPDTGATGTPVPQQIIVTGFRKSLQSAEEVKRDSVQVVDSIAASDIGAFPDRSVADSLQRIAGVQVGRDMGETGDVIIRGLPDVSTTLNGLEIFTGSGRRLAYQDLPVLSVSGLDVYKSLTADILEGGIAGSVNVRLSRPFDQKGFRALANLDMRRSQPQGSSQSPHYNDPSVGALVSNRWALDGHGEVGALFDAYYQRDRFAFPVQWNDRPDRVWSVDANGNASRLNGPDANGVYQPANPGERLATASHVGGIYNEGDRKRSSAHAAFQWKPNDKSEWTSHLVTMGYSNRRDTDYIFSIIGWTPHATNVVVAPAGPGCLPNNGGQPICPVLSSTNPEAQWGANPWNTDPYTATSTQAFDEHTRTNVGTLGLNFKDGPLRVNSELGFTQSKFVRDYVIVDQQVLHASSQTYTDGDDGHGGFTSVTTPTSQTPLRDPSQFVMRGLVQGWSEATGRQAQWRTDGEWNLGGDGFFRKLLGGLRLSSRHAEAHAAEGHADTPDNARVSPVQAFGSGFDMTVPGVDRLLGPFVTPDRDFLLDNTDTVRQFYGVANGRVPEDPNRFFSQTEKTYTVYGETRFGFDAGNVSIAGNAGVRVVRVDRHLGGTSQVGSTVTPIDLDTSETNVLPSVSAIVGWTDRLQSHFSIGKTITRPDFASLNPALALIPPTVNQHGFGNAGNPYLTPTKSTSSDATIEYYFQKNGYVQAAAFDRRIDGYLQNFTQQETIDGVVYDVTRPQNSGKGHLYGLELGGQAFFDFLPAPWNNFGVQANYTLVNGTNETKTALNGGSFTTTPITGVAKHNYNLVLMYQGNGITARLAANHRGEFTDTIAEPPFGLNNVVRAATYVDLGLGYALTKNVSIQFDAVNLTHTNYESYIGDPIRPRDIRYNPASYTLGLRLSL